MAQIDTQVFALITGGTLFAVGILKKLFPKFMEGKEEVFSLSLPVLFVVAAKLLHAFQSTGWVEALLWAVGGGIGAGLGWDYAAKPILAKLFGKNEVKPSEPAKPEGGNP